MNDVFLDHIGFIVEDLEAARHLFAGLGFTLTPRADHTRRDAQGQVVPAGSSQHSAMFDTGYIELMQITDPRAGHPLTAAMRERFGLHVLALGTDDATNCHALRQDAGLPVGPVMDWSRPVSTSERQGLARFLFFDTPWTAGDASYVCWVQHATPELVRSPSLLNHANGVHALRGVHYAGPGRTLQAWAQRLQQAGAVSGTRMNLGNSWIALTADESLSRVLPVAITLGLPDPHALASRAQGMGIPVVSADLDCIEIDLSGLAGLRLRAVRESFPPP